MKTRLSLVLGFVLFAAALAHAADVPSVKQRPEVSANSGED
jgi:hypothetical protein